MALAGEAGLGPADVITHHLDRGEIEATWEDRKVKVVVDQIGKTARAA